MTSTLEPSTAARDPLLALSNGMVRLYKEVFGRGPRRARASYAGADSLVVVLEHTLTKTERSLARLNDYRRLHEVRVALQPALEPQARALVEEVLGRRAIAFATGLDAHQDVAAVVFILAPRAEDGNGHVPSSDGRQLTSDGHSRG